MTMAPFGPQSAGDGAFPNAGSRQQMTRELQKILHVDDDPDIREIARIALETVGGFEVTQCDSGTQALTVAPRFAPDLILLDYMMPGMDGAETLKNLRTITMLQDVPVVFMTAKAQEDSRATLLECGATDVVIKPFDPMTLADTIRQIWDRVEA